MRIGGNILMGVLMLSKLSKTAINELLKDVAGDVLKLIEAADAFDRRKCTEAADNIDDLLKKMAKRNEDSERLRIRKLRRAKNA